MVVVGLTWLDVPPCDCFDRIVCENSLIMEGMLGYGDYSAIGSTNSGVVPFIGNRFMREHSDDKSDIIDNLHDKKAAIASFGRKFADMDEKGHSLEEYRGDTLNDISSGLNLVASGIKVITTILSLFGADTVDR